MVPKQAFVHRSLACKAHLNISIENSLPFITITGLPQQTCNISIDQTCSLGKIDNEAIVLYFSTKVHSLTRWKMFRLIA